MNTKKAIVFDLDDTLVKEIDFLKSAFHEIATLADSAHLDLFHQMMLWYSNKDNVFQNLVDTYPTLELTVLKNRYRNHQPIFEQKEQINQLLVGLKAKGYLLGIITDGYSVTQRNKIKALEIEPLLDLIVISEEFGSEKPSVANYEIFHQFNASDYFYVADNPSKDFVTPNKLGWQTICLLNNGQNIHSQNFDIATDSIYLPTFKVTEINEILNFIK